MFEENTNPWMSTILPAPAGTETPPSQPIESGNPPHITAETQSPAALTQPVTDPPHPVSAPTPVSAAAHAAPPVVESLSELQNLEVLRAEFASSVFKPKVILSYESISFNMACVKLMPDARYVNVLIDRMRKRIIILPVNKHAKDALQWCNIAKTGKLKKRTCTAKKFGEKLYDMMEWIKENKYRVLAYYQEVEGVRLLVFNLRECEMVVPEFITTKTGKVVKRGRVVLPGDYSDGFGMPLVKHSRANEVELNAHYTLSDKDKDVTIADVRVRGKAPSEEEIIMSQYRKEKAQEVFVGEVASNV
jgi:hypothetical protein